ncbi:MAG: hypothetical protein Q9213_004183, partial [Squamulea squamosa]
IIVEATKAGIAVYEKHGFRTEYQMRFEYPEKFREKAKPDLAFMRRVPKTTKKDDAE